MTNLKIEAKPAASAAEALEPHVRRLYDQPGLHLMFIGELVHVERTQPAPGTDKLPVVKVRIIHVEIPNAEQEPLLREAQRALFMHRTASGTLQDDGQLELHPDTLRLLAGHLHAEEAARLRVQLQHWERYARRSSTSPSPSMSEVREELRTVADGLHAALYGAATSDTD